MCSHTWMRICIVPSELTNLQILPASLRNILFPCSKILGITPGQYINQIKMNRARDYLYEKKYTIQQIAGFLGYPDPFTFSKAFKKFYNVPPSKFE